MNHSLYMLLRFFACLIVLCLLYLLFLIVKVCIRYGAVPVTWRPRIKLARTTLTRFDGHAWAFMETTVWTPFYLQEWFSLWCPDIYMGWKLSSLKRLMWQNCICITKESLRRHNISLTEQLMKQFSCWHEYSLWKLSSTSYASTCLVQSSEVTAQRNGSPVGNLPLRIQDQLIKELVYASKFVQPEQVWTARCPRDSGSTTLEKQLERLGNNSLLQSTSSGTKNLEKMLDWSPPWNTSIGSTQSHSILTTFGQQPTRMLRYTESCCEG